MWRSKFDDETPRRFLLEAFVNIYHPMSIDG
jgi:hypothetical protein